jgi:hypothetical protein
LFAYAAYGLVVLLLVATGLIVGVLIVSRSRRRNSSLQDLLDHADHLEWDLKDCRERLQKAHAVMTVSPDLPAAGELEAQQALDSGLRALLQQRLWIRDQAPAASQRELDEAVSALARARQQLEPRLRALDEAQNALDLAVREHIHREF